MLGIKYYKRLSIKFGIVCGMVVTLCGAFNAVLGSIQKWNETFEPNKELAATFDDTNKGEWRFEQRISGDVPPGTTITKGISVPPSPAPILEPEEPEPEDEPVSMSVYIEDDTLSAGSWLLVSLGGVGLMWFLIIAHRKENIKIKDDEHPDNIV